jgi:hypothetical protein
MISQFYDELTPLYHLVYADWEASMARQGENLENIIVEFWGDQARTILDASCGIGTQTLGLGAARIYLIPNPQSAGGCPPSRRLLRW